MSTQVKNGPTYLRSCRRCYERKIKCSRLYPCNNCITAKDECAFPTERIRRNRPSKARVIDSVSISHTGRDRERAPSQIGLGDSQASSEQHLPTETLETPYANHREGTDAARGSFSYFGDLPFIQRSDPAGMFWTPTLQQFQTCWNVYKKNVDPLIRILHKPSIEVLLSGIRTCGFASLSIEDTALLLVVCYTAISTLSRQQCLLSFSHPKAALRDRVEASIELALKHAEWQRNHNLSTLQAFTLLTVS
jgi:hypothetical protein